MFFCEFLMIFSPDFAPNSRTEWRLSILNYICENKFKNCRIFWNLWKLFNLIQSYSIVSLKVPVALPRRRRCCALQGRCVPRRASSAACAAPSCNDRLQTVEFDFLVRFFQQRFRFIQKEKVLRERFNSISRNSHDYCESYDHYSQNH